MDKKIYDIIFLNSDVVPFETPVIFSNIKFSFFVSDKKVQDLEFKDYTIPYKYKIYKNELENRTMSLPHPIAQIGMLCFMKNYWRELLNYYSIYDNNSLIKPVNIINIDNVKKYKLKDDFEEFSNEKIKNQFISIGSIMQKNHIIVYIIFMNQKN